MGWAPHPVADEFKSQIGDLDVNKATAIQILVKAAMVRMVQKFGATIQTDRSPINSTSYNPDELPKQLTDAQLRSLAAIFGVKPEAFS